MKRKFGFDFCWSDKDESPRFMSDTIAKSSLVIHSSISTLQNYNYTALHRRSPLLLINFVSFFSLISAINYHQITGHCNSTSQLELARLKRDELELLVLARDQMAQ
jgi:hypothetical protein